MARNARYRSSLNMYHVIIRGINKQNIFLDTQDKLKFVKELINTKNKYCFKIYAYVLMANHVHLVLKDGEIDVSKIMHRLQVCYSEYFNKKYDRIGHVFQGRFTSKNIEDNEYLKYVIRYVHINPDKAGIGKYDSYQWSSYKEYVETDNDESLTDKNDILELYGNNPDEAIANFKMFHKEKSRYSYNEEDSEFELTNRLDDEIIIKIIIENMGLKSIYDVQKLNNKYRDEILLKMLAIRGTTVSQISRITGISTKIIGNLKFKMNKNKGTCP